MSDTTLVFVYGTLQRNFSNHRYLAGCKFLGTGWTKQKYALYVSGIPFAIMAEPVSQIHGELYEVDDLTLEILDDLEGHPGWYQRNEVEVILDDGTLSIIKAWMYFHTDNSGTLVPSGIFSPNRF